MLFSNESEQIVTSYAITLTAKEARLKKVQKLYDSILYEILKRKAKLNYSAHQDTGYL